MSIFFFSYAAFETNTTNQIDLVSSGESYVPSENMIPSMVQDDFIHFETNVAHSQTNINHTGNTYFGESSNVPQDMVLNNTNSAHMSMVPCGPSYGNYHETNTNHMSWIPSEENHVLPQNVISSEANTAQVPCETTYGCALDDDLIVPIEDMISFDNLINEMDAVKPLLQDYGSSEVNTPLSTFDLSLDVTFNTQTDSIIHTSAGGQNQNQREGIERGDNNIGDDFNECMDWIDHVFNDDV